MSTREYINANCVNVMGNGVLIFGSSGSGKSDFTLRLLSSRSTLLEAPCKFVSDDQTLIWGHGDQLFGSAPAQIAGRLEVRGVGVLKFDFMPETNITCAIQLSDPGEIERIPPFAEQTIVLSGVQIPKFKLAPFQASAEEKFFSILMALHNGSLANDL